MKDLIPTAKKQCDFLLFVRLLPLFVHVYLGQLGQKQVYLDQLGQKQVHAKIKSKAHPTSPAIGPKRIVPVFGRTKPMNTGVCLLCLTSNCFFVVF